MNIKTSISLLLLGSLIPVNISGQERISRFVPGPEPDRIILTLKNDPATSFAVTWRTDTTITESSAQITPDLGSPFLADSALKITGNWSDIKGDGITARFHSVNFRGLNPETTYVYRVGTDTDYSEWFQFTTASVTPKPFSFIYFGDSQVVNNSLWSRVIRQSYATNPDAKIMIYGGDLVDGGDNGKALQDEEWGEWHKGGAFINSSKPTMPSPGNHEYLYPGDRSKRVLNRYWRAGFTLPENGPVGLEETAYYLDYQGVRFISLNSYELGRNEDIAIKQTAWLEQLLKDNPCKWTIIVFHHPLFSTSRTRDNKRLRDHLKPLIDKYNVDMILTGHDHTYARGIISPEGKEIKKNNLGTVYLVSVSGAKQYDQDAERWWDVGMTDTQFFQIVEVDGNELRYYAYDATGTLFDHLSIRKKNNGSKRLIISKTTN